MNLNLWLYCSVNLLLCHIYIAPFSRTLHSVAATMAQEYPLLLQIQRDLTRGTDRKKAPRKKRDTKYQVLHVNVVFKIWDTEHYFFRCPRFFNKSQILLLNTRPYRPLKVKNWPMTCFKMEALTASKLRTSKGLRHDIPSNKTFISSSIKIRMTGIWQVLYPYLLFILYFKILNLWLMRRYMLYLYRNVMS